MSTTSYLQLVGLDKVDNRTAEAFHLHGYLSTQAWLFDEGDAVVWIDGHNQSQVTIRVGDRVSTVQAAGLLAAMRMFGLNTEKYSKAVF